VPTSGAALYRTVQVEPASAPILRWRWRVDRVVDDADIRRKLGDDLLARLHIMFNDPLDRVPLIERSKVQLACSVAGDSRAALGESPPAITGIAIGADTDQTDGTGRGLRFRLSHADPTHRGRRKRHGAGHSVSR